MNTVYAKDAWGRSRLRDWQSMPLLMRAGFVAVDSRPALWLWSRIRIAAVMCTVALSAIFFNPFDGVVPAYSNYAITIASASAGLLFIFCGEYLLRAVTTNWYETWRSMPTTDRT